MLMHDVRLALRSLKRNPILSALMIGAIAVGIAASLIAMTLYHARAGHPIPWKEDKLFSVMMDNRDAEQDTSWMRHPEYPPFQVTYRDAMTLYESRIPERAAIMYRSMRVVDPDRASLKPFSVQVRVTTADFFSMFDVPFRYGRGWSRVDDETAPPIIVISKFLNEKVFGGENSVGREITLNGATFRVVGVLGAWMPQPKFYDPNWQGFDLPEDIFVPFGAMRTLKLQTTGSINCSTRAKVSGPESLLTEECVWLTYWAEFRSQADRDRFQSFVDNYVTQEKKHGRFPRELNNRIVNVSTYLEMWDVVGEDSRTQMALGLLFLVVCILNTLGLMLAKFLSAAPISGLRRALGASRVDIVRQHLIEVVVVGLLGGLVGLVLTLGGLAAVKVLMFSSLLENSDNPDRAQVIQALVNMDLSMIVVAVFLSLLAGILAGLYPALRIGRLAPATFLKTQ